MIVREVLAEWLKTHGYDGLVRDVTASACGCGLDDLMPCDGCDVANCEPAYEHRCDTCPRAKIGDDVGCCDVDDMPEPGGRCWGVDPFVEVKP